MTDEIIELIVRVFLYILNKEPERVQKVLDALPGATATREALAKRLP